MVDVAVDKLGGESTSPGRNTRGGARGAYVRAPSRHQSRGRSVPLRVAPFREVFQPKHIRKEGISLESRLNNKFK